MTVRKEAPRPAKSRRVCGKSLKDEVYRQMFRLEESRSGAEMSLALALLRAWLAASSNPERGEEREWLRKVSQICLEMIEAAFQAAETTRPSALKRPLRML